MWLFVGNVASSTTDNRHLDDNEHVRPSGFEQELSHKREYYTERDVSVLVLRTLEVIPRVARLQYMDSSLGKARYRLKRICNATPSDILLPSTAAADRAELRSVQHLPTYTSIALY